MAGDIAQRIYKRSFTWSGVGIRLPPAHSKKLHGSHRTTRQIMTVAQHLVDNSGQSGSVEGVQPQMPDRTGPKVKRIVRKNDRDARKETLLAIKRLAASTPGETIAIATPFNSDIKKIVAELGSLGVRAVPAKGATLAKHQRGIAVTTYHQLKGLEFDHLVLMMLQDRVMPGWYLKRIPEEDHGQEETLLRRLTYVALTRAKKSVLISGGTPISRFFSKVPSAAFFDL